MNGAAPSLSKYWLPSHSRTIRQQGQSADPQARRRRTPERGVEVRGGWQGGYGYDFNQQQSRDNSLKRRAAKVRQLTHHNTYIDINSRY